MSIFFLMYIWLISFDHEQLIARKAAAEKIRTAMGMFFNKVLSMGFHSYQNKKVSKEWRKPFEVNS